MVSVWKSLKFDKSWKELNIGLKVPIAAIKNAVCLQNTTKSHSYHMAFIMTLWIGNGAVLKSSSQW